MTPAIRRLTAREMTMITAALTAATLLMLVRSVVVPSYHEWRELQLQLQAQSSENARLARNLANRQSADDEFGRLPREAFQSNAEQITLDAWLRDLEAAARRPGLMLVNTRPLPVRHEAGYAAYTLQLSVDGRLPEVLGFASAAMHNPTVTGLNSFSMRAVQGSNNLECTFELCMVKLTGPGESGGRAAPASSEASPNRESADAR